MEGYRYLTGPPEYPLKYGPSAGPYFQRYPLDRIVSFPYGPLQTDAIREKKDETTRPEIL
jgi:hypothetical protein